MRIRKTRNRILGDNSRTKLTTHGSQKAPKRSGMALSEKPYRNQAISRFYRILPILRPKLLKNRTTPPRSYQETDEMALGRNRNQSVSDTKEIHVRKPSPHPTKFRKKILPPNGR